MATFTYKAMDKRGKEVKGTIEAEHTAQAINILRDKGFFPTNVVEHKGKKTKVPGAVVQKSGFNLSMSIALPGGNKIKPKQLTQFTRQLATLIDAGLPLVRSVTVLRDQAKPGPVKNISANLAEEVEAGSTFSEALSKHPKTFSKLYINMIKAGEVGGVLEVVLERLATFAEKTEKLKARIKSAMVYPILVVIISVGVLAFLMTVIIPQFMKIFKDMNATLPGITILLQHISVFMLTKWYIMLGLIIGLVAIYRSLAKMDKTKYYVDMVKIRLPVFGQLANKVGIGRFARTLGTLINSGVPILQALQIVKDTAENEVIARAIGAVHGSIREGESIAKPLGKSKVFPLFVVNMIDVGEETGSLDQMLLKIADAYDEEVDTMVAGLTSLLEPILIVGMGGMVGFIVVAMFMPLISLMGQLGGG